MQKPEPQLNRYSPFWVCLFVFVALGVNSGLQFSNLVKMRQQLSAAEADKEKKAAQLTQIFTQSQQIEARLKAFAADLYNMAQTNGPARQIVQEFQIQVAPDPQPQPSQQPAQPQPTAPKS